MIPQSRVSEGVMTSQMSDGTTTTRWRLHNNGEAVSGRSSGWWRQEGDNDTWRQKREARMEMTTTMMMMTCVVRSIMAWLQRHDGEDDGSRIVTTGRWRRWLEYDVETVTTMIAESSRQDGDDDGNWKVTTGGWRIHNYDGNASSVWQNFLNTRPSSGHEQGPGSGLFRTRWRVKR